MTCPEQLCHGCPLTSLPVPHLYLEDLLSEVRIKAIKLSYFTVGQEYFWYYSLFFGCFSHL